MELDVGKHSEVLRANKSLLFRLNFVSDTGFSIRFSRHDAKLSLFYLFAPSLHLFQLFPLHRCTDLTTDSLGDPNLALMLESAMT